MGIKPISPFGAKRADAARSSDALDNKKRVVTIMHKGNIQKFTEGAFRDWGYELAAEEFRAQTVTERETWILGNRDKDPDLTIEQNAALVEPGLEQGTDAFRKSVCDEVKSVLGQNLRRPTGKASGSRSFSSTTASPIRSSSESSLERTNTR